MKWLKQVLLGVGLFFVACAYTLYLWRREMDSTSKRNLDSAVRLTIIVALLIGVVRLMCGCAKPVVAYPQPVLVHETGFHIIYADSQPSAGITACGTDGLPLISLHTELLYSPQLMVLMAHELTHVTDMLAFGPCEEYMKAFRRSAEFRLKAETHAYCKEMQVGTLVLGWKWAEELDYFAHMLSEADAYALNMPFEKVYRYMQENCKELE